MDIICPKCSFNRQDCEDPDAPLSNCPNCGIAYAKVDPRFAHLTPTAPLRRQPNNTAEKSDHPPYAINIAVVTMVANFFLGSSLLCLIVIVVIGIAAVSSDAIGFSMIMIGPLCSAMFTLAWFGYVVKLLLGIYINTLK